MKWFVNGEPTEYKGGRTTSEIVTWINKRSGPPTRKVSHEELDLAIEQNKFTVVFYGDDSSVEFA